MKKKTMIAIGVCLFCLSVFVPGTFFGTALGSKNQIKPQHEVRVTLKLIQVYVTDKQGKPVTDLKKEDFVLYDSGEPVEITDFERHILQPSIAEVEEIEEPSINMCRKFYLFFDFAFNNEIGIRQSKAAALHFLDTVPRPEDEIGVISYSTNKYLTLHEPLTENHQKVRKVVEGFGLKNVLGRAEEVEQKYWGKVEEMTRIGLAKEVEGGEENAQELSARPKISFDEGIAKEMELKEIEANRSAYKHYITVFMETMKELALSLAYVPGRKNIVFFSSGIPESVFSGVAGLKTTVDSRGNKMFVRDAFGDTNLSDKYDNVIQELASSNSSVYAVYAEGTDAGFDWDAGSKDRQMLGYSSLQRLSQKTGGRFYGNIKNYEKAAEEIQQVTGSYYVLGYSVNEKWDGKFHKIKVDVEREDCKVAVQEGYFNPRPFDKYSSFEKRLHFVQLALEETTGLQPPEYFMVSNHPFYTQGQTGSMMMAKIPVEALQKVSGKKVEMAYFVFDQKDQVVDFKRWETNFGSLPKKDIYYYCISSLAPGIYKSRVVIRNLETGESAVGSSDVSIPGPKDSGLQLFPPLCMIEDKKPFFLKGSLIEEKEGQKAVGLFDLYRFDPSKYSPVVRELKQGTSKFVTLIRCSAYNIQEPEVKIFARLIHKPDYQMIPIKFFGFTKYKSHETETYILGIETEKLKAGHYILDFFAQDEKSGSTAQVKTDMAVR